MQSSEMRKSNGKSRVVLPVIDLAGLARGEAARKEIVKQVGKACSEWGFFHIVNHGVPEETVQAVLCQGKKFFGMSREVKKSYRPLDPHEITLGYIFDEKTTMEGFSQFYYPSPAVEALTDLIWPEGNPTFSESIHTFCKEVNPVSVMMLELVAESLGLHADVFAQHFRDTNKYRSSLRMHRYPPREAHIIEKVGAREHKDSGVLALLTHDIAGLEFWKGGEFVEIEPLPHAFIVNIGETIQAWSNDRFPSISHRVVLDEKLVRSSLIYFIYAPPELSIECPPELVDDAHPQLYRPFTYPELRRTFHDQAGQKGAISSLAAYLVNP